MAMLGILRNVPFVNTSLAGLTDPNRSYKIVDKIVKSTLVPGGAQQVAEYFDQRDKSGQPVKRTP